MRAIRCSACNRIFLPEEIIFTRGANGRARVKVSAPGGQVELKGDFSGEAAVDIHAPGGQVILGEETSTCINGSGRISITAATVDIRGRVDGSPRLDITLNRGGKLKFTELAGGVQLACHRAAPNDPEPAVDRGRVLGGARFTVE
jgi:hypothetical protein